MPSIYLASPHLRELLTRWFRDAFSAELPNIRFDIGERIESGDTKYLLFDPDEARAIIGQNPAMMRYDEADRYDCEDIAFAARVAVAHHCLITPPPGRPRVPPAFGFLLTRHHALNIGIDRQQRPYLYDVHTNRICTGQLSGEFLEALGNYVPLGWLRSIRSIRYVFI